MGLGYIIYGDNVFRIVYCMWVGDDYEGIEIFDSKLGFWVFLRVE